jgi:hypothetical protein
VSILTIVLLVAGAIVITAVAGTLYSRYQYGSVGLLPAALRLISASLAIVITAFLLPSAWQDAGRLEALFILMVPVLCGLTAVSTDIVKRGQAVITTVVSAVMVFWSLLNGLSPAFLYIIPAFVMIAAAATSWFQRKSVTPSTSDATRVPHLN